MIPGVLGTALLAAATAFAGESQATKRLTARNAEFEKAIIKVTDGVYTAIGYTVLANSMIVGGKGVIIVAAGQTIEGAQKYLMPDELAACAKLPDHLAPLDYLGDYYGSVSGAIRDIHAQELGWFDRDPLGAAQLARHVIRLRPDDPEPKLMLADTLAIVGERTFNAPSRNYTLAYSNRLRRQAKGEE